MSKLRHQIHTFIADQNPWGMKLKLECVLMCCHICGESYVAHHLNYTWLFQNELFQRREAELEMQSP